jgi:hypothetical protein
MHSPPDDLGRGQTDPAAAPDDSAQNPKPVSESRLGAPAPPEKTQVQEPSTGSSAAGTSEGGAQPEEHSNGEPSPPPTGDLPPDPPDYKAVARISTQATLENLQLAFVHADVLRGLTMPEDWTEHRTTSSNASGELDREDLTLVVYCGFVTAWSPEMQAGGPAPTPEAAPFELHARFRLEYLIKDLESIEAGDEVHFAWTNGMLHAWPYWREIAQTTTLRMGLPPLVVGTFKIPWSGDPDREKKNRAAERTAAAERDADTPGEPTAQATTASQVEKRTSSS